MYCPLPGPSGLDSECWRVPEQAVTVQLTTLVTLVKLLLPDSHKRYPPTPCADEDEDDRERSWWTAKKWLYAAVDDAKDYAAFAAHSTAMFAPEILAIYLC
ncbi:hypothetical protein DFH06DRAFT_1340856 [Mycena polygramma]|nr:hypothetical protein DFH06DRAFT_1340856 [Mycena polygramma]